MEKEQYAPKKIAFVGAAGIGKTTLLDELRQQYTHDPSVVFVEEVGRAYFEENPTEPHLVFSFEVQKAIQDRIIKNEQDVLTQKPTTIFCDRSVVDAVVHLQAHENKEGADQLLGNVETWLPTYTLFLLLDPGDVPYETDAIRREDEETRNHIHDAFLRFFTETQLPYQLLSGTVEERLIHVKKLVSQLPSQGE